MEKNYCIVMKSGVEHWLTEAKAKEIGDLLTKQTKHSFIRVAELGGRVINTAEIEDGPCSKDQMMDRQHLKNKDWLCIENKWHEQKQKCFCASEKARAERQKEQDKEREESMRPRTPAEQKRALKALAENRKILEDKGILSKKMSIPKENLINASPEKGPFN